MTTGTTTDDGLLRRHLAFGWWTLLFFLVLGIALEAMHGFKVGWYLDVGNETRRLMFRLAHAHGVLLGLVNVVFGLSRPHLGPGGPGLTAASRLLRAAIFLLPGGFFLGGIVVYGGDPFLGVLLVPLGALALFAGVLLVARRTGGPA